jgi:alkaline phosphatase
MTVLRSKLLTCALVALAMALSGPVLAAPSTPPSVTRLAPPSRLFSNGYGGAPVTARFLPGQRFDLQATVSPGAGQTITEVKFYVNGKLVPGTVTLASATVAGLPTNTMIASLRAYSKEQTGVHGLSVVAKQGDGQVDVAEGNFEIVPLGKGGDRIKNVIILIGDGMGIAHRTAARIMRHGVTQGKPDGRLAMDSMPYTGIVMTHSLNSIVTDSSPGASCYSTGNKANNNQHCVFPDDTTDAFDNPRVESIGEYMRRTRGAALGIVTTSDVFDATPGAFASHTQNRGAGTGICDQYLDERNSTGLRVVLGGGRKWFLPSGTPGSARSAGNDYVLPAELATAWGVPQGAIDPTRNLISDFQAAGFVYVPDRTSLNAVPGNTTKLLGLFALSNMNVAKDKIDGRRGSAAVVNDYGFPDQPLLREMTKAALRVLSKERDGFCLMVEAASIDKQAHNMDTERWILDTIEFDDAIDVCLKFAKHNEDTLVIVTADHECAGINIIGGSRVTDSDLQARAATGQGASQLRTGVVGTYESAGFPRYVMATDGYPLTTDIDFRMLIGYAANADRYEDWRTNPQPLRDSQQPFNNVAPLNTYPSGPLNRDVAGNFLVTGQIGDGVAAHTASDIPISAAGCGASRFTGVMDNTDVFFRIMEAVVAGGSKDECGDDDDDDHGRKGRGCDDWDDDDDRWQRK